MFKSFKLGKLQVIVILAVALLVGVPAGMQILASSAADKLQALTDASQAAGSVLTELGFKAPDEGKSLTDVAYYDFVGKGRTVVQTRVMTDDGQRWLQVQFFENKWRPGCGDGNPEFKPIPPLPEGIAGWMAADGGCLTRS